MKQVPDALGPTECFFCGPLNPAGLKLVFHVTESEPIELVCRWRPPSLYSGLGRIVHGGIQSGLFDEIMGWTATHLTRQVGLTVGLQVKFVKPLYVEQEIEVRCRLKSRNGAKIELEAEIRNSSGQICTEGTGTYFLMERGRFKELVEQD
jgi:acyl-coenzyme A thioesterase PaaI-like protein